jgi:DNA-directed RNA polymerase subunit RPC12/RpoP
MSANDLDLLCEHCGQAFSQFMHELAAKNAKVVCPHCNTSSVGKPAKAANPVADAPSPKKTV